MVSKKVKGPPNQQLLKKEEEKTDLSPFVPLVEKWLDGQHNEVLLNHEISKEELAVIRNSNHYSFWLLIVIIAGVFVLAAGLIFWKNNLDAGLLILSHVGAIVAGLIAGMGFERSRPSVDN